MRESLNGAHLENTCFRAVVIATLVIVATLFATSPNSEPREPTSQKQIESSASQEKQPESFWEKTTTDPVALYTGVLAVFTAALVVVSGFQLYFLNRSDKTARLSAEAAMLTATSDRAWIIHSDTRYADERDLTVDGVFFDRAITLQLMWENKGKTPALETSAYINHKIENIIDKKPPNFDSVLEEGAPVPIGPEKSFFTVPVVITGVERERVLNKTSAIILYSIVRYKILQDRINFRTSEACLLITFDGYRKVGDKPPVPNWNIRVVGPQNTLT